MLDMEREQRTSLEPNTAKLLNLCRSNVEYAARTGMLENMSKLHAWLRLFALISKAGSDEVEEFNSLVKLQSERCRGITLDLLHARTSLKKLSCPIREYKVSWRHQKHFISVLHRLLAIGHASHKTVLSDPQRWSTAPPVPVPQLKLEDATLSYSVLFFSLPCVMHSMFC